MLKKLMIGAAFVAMLAAPALAQSYDPELGSGNVLAGPNGGGVGGPTEPGLFGGPYAYEPRSSRNGYAHQPSDYDSDANDKIYHPGGSSWRSMRRSRSGQY
jgi:hypothetical protein